MYVVHLPIAKREIRKNENVVSLSIVHREQQTQFCLLEFTSDVDVTWWFHSFWCYCPLVKTNNWSEKEGGKQNRKLSHQSVKMSFSENMFYCACLFKRLWLRAASLWRHTMSWRIPSNFFFVCVRKNAMHCTACNGVLYYDQERDERCKIGWKQEIWWKLTLDNGHK